MCQELGKCMTGDAPICCWISEDRHRLSNGGIWEWEGVGVFKYLSREIPNGYQMPLKFSHIESPRSDPLLNRRQWSVRGFAPIEPEPKRADPLLTEVCVRSNEKY